MSITVFYPGQKDYIQKMNDLWGRATLSLTGTSTSSVLVGTGSKSFTTDTDRQWPVGSPVLAMRTSNPTGVWVYGTVTSYDPDTGALVMNSTVTSGSGTYTDWTITVSGVRGATGSTGAAGLTHRGAWASATAYVVNDAVTYGGGTYRRKVAGTTATVPSSDATNWELLAAKGDTGNTGPANTLTIGTVTTGAAGSAAAATVTGTAPNQTLNLTIPQGTQGIQGVIGPAGLVWKGAWVSGTTYAINDAVTNSGSSYRRKVAGAGTTAPGSDAANWELLAQRGADGTGNVNTVNNVAPVGGNVTLVKADIGLGNVDNTSDANKPVSTPQQTALDGKLDKTGGTMTGAINLANSVPTIHWDETDQTGAVGKRRTVADGGDWRIDRNTAAARDYSTYVTDFKIDNNGAVTFSQGGATFGTKVLTLGGSFTTSGAFSTTFTMTGATSVTFPTSGTLFSSGVNNLQASGTYLAFDAASVIEGRILASGNALHIQAGSGSGDTTGVINLNRNGTTTTNFAAFNVYADTTTYYGNVTINSALDLNSTYPNIRFHNSNGTTGEKQARLDWENSRFAFQLYQDDGTTWTRDLLLLDKNGNATFGGALTLGTALAANQGGTGLTSYTTGDLLYATSGTAIGKLAAGGAGTVLMGNGPAAAPSYGTLDLSFLPTAWTKKSCRVATTVALSGTYASNVLTGSMAALIIDGVTLATGNRVLVKNQASALQNGLYYVSNPGVAGTTAWTLTRVPDCNFADEMANAVVAVDEGTQNGLWVTKFKGTDTVGTSTVVWHRMWDGDNPTIVTYTEAVYAPAAGSAFTVDLANGPIQRFTTNANTTITLPAAVAGKSYIIELIYGGAHTVTFAGGTAIKWPGDTAPTVTSVSGKRDKFSFICPTSSITDGSVIGLNYPA